MSKVNREVERYRRLVDSFRGKTITVVGDLVADEFVYGEISRVSREAPVLILKHRERKVVPGGGANAVMNLADLGVTVLPVGVVGNDEQAKLLLECFTKKKISVSGIVRLKGYTTTTKTRILAGTTHSGRQQVVRMDREPEPLHDTHPALLNIVSAAKEFLQASDALLVSDYGYGAATPRVLNFIRSKGAFRDLPVTLDSRYRMLEFSGITAATPNEPEVEAALGVQIRHDTEKLYSSGKQLLEKMKLQSLVITRGSDGMCAFERGEEPELIPVHGSDQVTDVTGAGDTVIATFTAALAAGADTITAARIANFAGGIVVMKRGTATVSRRELTDAMEQNLGGASRQ